MKHPTPFFRFKFSQFSSESQNLPEVGCLRVQNRFQTFLYKKRKFAFYIININLGHNFDDFFLGAPAARKSDLFGGELGLLPT